MDKNNVFNLIFDAGEFKELFNFIRDGFGWSDKFADKISKLVLTSQTNTPIAAVNRTNGEINIALLIIFQGVTADGQLSVLNLSSWYAAPEKRGVVVVNFAKKLLDQLRGYVITNYTPNDAAGKIFRSIGFKSMDVSMLRGGFLRRMPYWDSRAFRALDISKKVTLASLNSSSSLQDARGEVRYNLYPRKVMGITFNVMNLYQTDRTYWPPSIWQVLHLMFCNRALMLVIYFIDSTQSKDRAKWLIYDPIGGARYIPPLGSELNIIK